MIDPYRSKWVAGAVLLAILVFFGTCNYTDYLRNRAIKAEERASLAQAQIAGLNEALAAKPKEVVKTVTLTKEVVRLVKSGDVKPVVGAKVETSTKEVPLPACPDPLKSEATSFTSDSVSKGTVLKAESLGVQTGFELFVGVAGQDKPMWTGTVKTTLTAPNYRQEVSWTEEELKEGANVTFSEDILKALKAQETRPSRFALLPRSWKHWRVGPVAGVGVAYNPANGQFSGAAFAGLGVQF